MKCALISNGNELDMGGVAVDLRARLYPLYS